MADGLSTLSSETLTAAVTCLLQKPLPESHIIKSSPIQTKHPTNLNVRNEIHKQMEQPVNELQYLTLQPLKLPIYQDSSQNVVQPESPAQRLDTSQYASDKITDQQIQDVTKTLGNNDNQQMVVSNSGNSIQLLLHSVPQRMRNQEQNVQNLNSSQGNMAIGNRVLSHSIRKPFINFPQQNFTAQVTHTNNLLFNRATLQPNTGVLTRHEVTQNSPGHVVGISILPQMVNAQSQGQGHCADTGVQRLQVVPGNSQQQVPQTNLPTEPPFSQLSPTQPLQNLIQHLFSNSDSLSKPSNGSVEQFTATPVSLANMEVTTNSLISTSNEKTPEILTTQRDQDSYASHINLLVEAILKNKTLTPQQYQQIQKSILNSHEPEVKPSNLCQALVQGQNLVLQGPSHIEMAQNSRPALHASERSVTELQQCPILLHRVSPDGPFQLIHLTNLGQGKVSDNPRGIPVSSSSSGTKTPVCIQPKPTSGYIDTQALIQSEPSIVCSQVIDTHSAFDPGTNQTGINEIQDSQQLYNEGTNQVAAGMSGTNQQEMEHIYSQSMDTREEFRNGIDLPTVPAPRFNGQTHTYPTGIQEKDRHIEMDSVEENHLDRLESDDDDYIYCIDCRKLCKDRCEIHTGIEYKFIRDTIIQSRARASLPSLFYLKQSSASIFKDHLGVWCRESINEGTRLGPVIGVQQEMKTEECKQQIQGFNPFQISEKDSVTCVLTLENEDLCNWIMFVRIAHSLLEQNCVLFKHRDKFYFTTICEIKEDEEMLMWFSKDLCQYLGISEDPGVAKLQQCDHCGKYFTTKKLLNNHSKEIHPDKYKFSCGMCGKMFNSQSRLNNHTITHLGMKPYECQMCGKCFSDSSNLKQHMNIHTGVKKFQCETCGKTFRQKAHRDIHAVTHTGNKNYKCSYCDKSFARQTDLKTHTYRHTKELQYQCTYCQKIFYKTQALKKHLKVHTGERNYMCGKCFKGFQTKYHRDRHLKTCKEKDSKETSYMSLEEVAKLDSTCDAVPLKTVKPDENISGQSLLQSELEGKISHTYYS